MLDLPSEDTIVLEMSVQEESQPRVWPGEITLSYPLDSSDSVSQFLADLKTLQSYRSQHWEIA